MVRKARHPGWLGLLAVAVLTWLDVSREPVVIHAPDSGARYVSIQLAEFYSDLFGYAGPSVNGGRAQTALVVGPAWEGETPAGIDAVFHSPPPRSWSIEGTTSRGQPREQRRGRSREALRAVLLS